MLVLAAFIFYDFLTVCLSVGYFFCYVSELLMLFYYFFEYVMGVFLNF